jgi:hypothetical protein
VTKAIPLASVVVEVALTDPPPETSVQVTVAPCIGWPN